MAELADALVESGFDNVSKDEIQAMMREVDTGALPSPAPHPPPAAVLPAS